MSPHPYVRAVLFCLLCLLQTSPVNAQHGALTLPRNLVDLSSRAETVIVGRVLSARLEQHPQYSNFSTVVVTITVRESLKGSAEQTYSFRQIIWDPRDRADMAGFRRGQEMLLFMNKTNAAGVTSPVGLEQGKFLIRRDQGTVVASNSRNNVGLFQGITSSKKTQALSARARSTIDLQGKKPGAMPLDVLLEATRAFLKGGAE